MTNAALKLRCAALKYAKREKHLACLGLFIAFFAPAAYFSWTAEIVESWINVSALNSNVFPKICSLPSLRYLARSSAWWSVWHFTLLPRKKKRVCQRKYVSAKSRRSKSYNLKTATMPHLPQTYTYIIVFVAACRFRSKICVCLQICLPVCLRFSTNNNNS